MNETSIRATILMALNRELSDVQDEIARGELEAQRTIETFHANFEASQQDLIAKKQSYRTLITATTPGLVYNWISGFPHIKVGIPTGTQDDYAIVTSDKTQNDFKTKKAPPLQITQ